MRTGGVEAWGPAYEGWKEEAAEAEELGADCAVEEVAAEQDCSFAMDASTYAPASYLLLGRPAA